VRTPGGGEGVEVTNAAIVKVEIKAVALFGKCCYCFFFVAGLYSLLSDSRHNCRMIQPRKLVTGRVK
jgi:hypothetical protein